MDKSYTKEGNQLKETKQVEEVYSYDVLLRKKEGILSNIDILNAEIAKIDALLAECQRLGIGDAM